MYGGFALFPHSLLRKLSAWGRTKHVKQIFVTFISSDLLLPDVSKASVEVQIKRINYKAGATVNE